MRKELERCEGQGGSGEAQAMLLKAGSGQTNRENDNCWEGCLRLSRAQAPKEQEQSHSSCLCFPSSPSFLLGCKSIKRTTYSDQIYTASYSALLRQTLPRPFLSNMLYHDRGHSHYQLRDRGRRRTGWLRVLHDSSFRLRTAVGKSMS